MGASLHNKECPCPTEPQPAPYQRLQSPRVQRLRCLMTRAVMVPCESRWHPMSKRTVALRGIVPTPQCSPQNGTLEQNWMKKATWLPCMTSQNKVHTERSKVAVLGDRRHQTSRVEKQASSQQERWHLKSIIQKAQATATSESVVSVCLSISFNNANPRLDLNKKLDF